MPEATVHGRFESWALKTPTALAIRDNGQSFTFADLAARAASLAARVQALCRGDSDVFAVLLANDPVGEIAAVLGVLSVGGIAVPVEATQPVYKVRQIIDHCSPTAILASQRDIVRQLLPEHEAIGINEPAHLQISGRIGVLPDAPAYICYTSGSTGEPKGVVITHRQVLARIDGLSSVLGFTPSDRHTLLNSLSTGHGMSTVWRGLLTGGGLLPGRVRDQGVANLLNWLNTEGATLFACSATLFRTFVAQLKPGDRLESVRLLRMGSERVTPAEFALFKRWCTPEAVFVNAYSCSEASTVTWHQLTHGDHVEGDSVPIGRAIPGCSVRLFGEDGAEVPIGETGEIVVEGVTVASGYWRDPVRSAPVFQAVEGNPLARRLRTGDLARMHPDGTLVHAGRRDFRVKIRGFRVELEGVESVLSRAPNVRQAAALLNGTGGDATLVAFVATESPDVDEERLRAFAKAHLPVGSVPHRFLFADALPIGPSGKLDRKQLRDFAEAALASMSTAGHVEGTEIEQQVAGIWREVLGHEQFGLTDDFLLAGGDSIRAMRVLTRLNERFALDIPLTDFLQSPTIAWLAATVEGQSREQLSLDEAEFAKLLDEAEGKATRD
jgi:amino acid adenylation domain-containing protein